MKIFRTKPEESTQWQSDSPSVKAIRLILPIAAILSAVSLSGGLASFLELKLTNNLHLILAVFFAIAAFFFDGLGISSGRSVVRDFILSAKGEIERGYLFWISVALAALIAVAVVLGSFRASQDGIKYLVMEAKKAQGLKTETDTTLTATVDQASDQNAAILAAKQEAYEAEKAAIIATYAGKIEAVNIDLAKQKRQRTGDNYQFIDNQVSRLEKRRAELEAKKGAELAGLASSFADEQARLLATTESLTAVTVEDAKEASERRKKKQDAKDQADEQLSNLVSGIFSWSIVLMLFIGVRLEILETRNGILPNPILSNADLSGLEGVKRFVTALPYFVFSWVNYAAEKLYEFAAKKPVPIVDNDLIDYNAAQQEEEAIRKEGKIRTLPKPITRRAIGYNQAAAQVGSKAENNLPPLSANFEPRLNHENKPDSNHEKKDLINQIKISKRELRKYKKRQSSSYQKILQAQKKGEEPQARTVQAYENRSEWVQRLESEIQQLEEKLNSL